MTVTTSVWAGQAEKTACGSVKHSLRQCYFAFSSSLAISCWSGRLLHTCTFFFDTPTAASTTSFGHGNCLRTNTQHGCGNLSDGTI